MSIQALLDALGDRTGREILTILKEGKISSGELAKRVGLSPSALSYHLSKLKKAGWIYEIKEKNFIFYTLDLTVLDEAILWIENLKRRHSDEK